MFFSYCCNFDSLCYRPDGKVVCSGNSGLDYGGSSDDWGWSSFGSYEDDNDADNDCFDDPSVSVCFQISSITLLTFNLL